MDKNKRVIPILLSIVLGCWFQQAMAEETTAEETQAQEANSTAPTATTETGAPAEAAAENPPSADVETAVDAPIPALAPGEQEEAETLVHQVVDRVREEKAAEEKAQAGAPDDAVRINHVPAFIKEEIRNQVRSDLHADVLQDVLTQAKNEQWGIPYALPSWVNKVSFKGDIRLRAQDDIFASSNQAGSYTDVSVVNASGGFANAGPDVYTNVTEDRLRLRARARLKIDAKVTEGIKAGLRLSTGNQKDPVSTNQTLGTYDNRYQTVWDQVYLEYKGYDEDRYPYLTLVGGRMPNPWMSTDLVWDGDLAFEGVAATYRKNLRGSDNLLDMTEHDQTMFATIGAFPLQEVDWSANDKWLYGGQVGAEFQYIDQSKLKFALAYYVFDNITGVRNKTTDSKDMDYTAPQYMQKGNILFNIRNSNDPAAELWALAAQYREINLTASYDMASYAPLHVVMSGDMVKNIGYDQKAIDRRAQGVVERAQGWQYQSDPTKARTLGYQLGVTVGWPVVTQIGNWNVSLFYKYLERDAVLDAFTDSDFHLGGTDAKGWIVTYNYGLEDNAWVSARWITSDSIDGAQMGVDSLQVDVNAKF